MRVLPPKISLCLSFIISNLLENETEGFVSVVSIPNESLMDAKLLDSGELMQDEFISQRVPISTHPDAEDSCMVGGYFIRCRIADLFTLNYIYMYMSYYNNLTYFNYIRGLCRFATFVFRASIGLTTP